MANRPVALILIGALAIAPAFAQQRRQTVSNTPIIQAFDANDDENWWRADKRTGGKKTNDTGFSAGNIKIDNGEMTLTLSDAPYRGRGHTGASYKSHDLYDYGRYDVIMKAARGAGVVSAFYTYTGPVFGDPHDEIDFEFLGRDTTEVQLNYFVAGAAQLGRAVPLGFDAADGFHLYTIEWRRGEIVWLADGKELMRAVHAPHELPEHAGKIIAEIWAAKGIDKWAGRLEASSLPATAIVRCISFVPVGGEGLTCADQRRAGGNTNGAVQ